MGKKGQNHRLTYQVPIKELCILWTNPVKILNQVWLDQSTNRPDRSNALSIEWISCLLSNVFPLPWTNLAEVLPKYISYQVWPQSENNYSCESTNGLSRSKWMISWLSPHLTSYVSHERTTPRPCPKIHLYQVRSRSEENCTDECDNDPPPPPRTPRSEKNCIRESANRRDLVPRYISTKLDRNRTSIVPERVLTGLVDSNH